MVEKQGSGSEAGFMLSRLMSLLSAALVRVVDNRRTLFLHDADPPVGKWPVEVLLLIRMLVKERTAAPTELKTKHQPVF